MNIKNTLRKDADKNPLWHAVVLWLFAAGLASLPSKELFLLFIVDETSALYAAQISVRAVLTVAAVVLINAYGFSGLITKRVGVKSLLSCLPVFLVAVNNFPIIGAIKGDAVFLGNTTYTVLFVVNCLFIGLFEESVFRGIIFPLIFIRLKNKKRAAFNAAAVSSVVFAITHIINIFGGAGISGTLLQIGYSFLVGGMCAVSVLKTGSIFPAVVIHFIYDFGGLILSENYKVAAGFQWDTLTVIITAVLGVIVAACETVYAIKCKAENLRESCGIDKTDKDEEKEITS